MECLLLLVDRDRLVNHLLFPDHSGIYIHSPEQKEIAIKSMKAEQVSGL